MAIQILFFGSITEVTGKSQHTLDCPRDANVHVIDNLLLAKWPALAEFKYRISVNEELASSAQLVKDGDELAILPPFAGG
ncbi:MAG: molybdopterin converting factor small subunit [Limisphaerales bacterium]|jgi:molybdopterin converting factor small subunit